MKNKQDQIGIALTVAVTAIALVAVGNLGATQQGSIQPQGEALIDLANEELSSIPETSTSMIESVEERISNTVERIDEIIEESNSASELAEEGIDLIEKTLPDVPDVVKQSQGTLLELVSIPPKTGTPGCEESDACFLPVTSTIAVGGEVIWTNHDTVVHTVTSGNPSDGPSGLFDSGLVQTGGTYSLEFKIPFEYDYFCIVHPWMEGTVIVE